MLRMSTCWSTWTRPGSTTARWHPGPTAAHWAVRLRLNANPPQVRNVQGRIAVAWEPKESLELVTDAAIPLTDFSLVVGVANASLEAGECAVEFRGTEGTRSALLSAPPAGGWHQVALVYRGGAGTFFADGNPTTRMAPSVPKDVTAIRLGSANPTPFTGALTRVQLFQRALSVEEVAQLYALWTNEWQTPQPNPAAFVQPPTAVNTATVVMPPSRASPRSDRWHTDSAKRRGVSEAAAVAGSRSRSLWTTACNPIRVTRMQ